MSVCVITRAAGDGIGPGLCRAMADAGHVVVVTDPDGEAAAERAERLRNDGLAAEAIAMDVTDPASIEKVVAGVVERHGHVDGLVNGAGIGLVEPAADVTLEDWARLLAADLRGAWLCCQAVIATMAERGGGSIVNIGPIQAPTPHRGSKASPDVYPATVKSASTPQADARTGAPGWGRGHLPSPDRCVAHEAAYAAAKASLVGLTRGIAADYGTLGVRCNMVHPGLVDGERTRRLIAGWADPTAWMRQYVATGQLLPTAITSDQIGAAVAFLLSDGAAAITATELVVDAGSSMLTVDRSDE